MLATPTHSTAYYGGAWHDRCRALARHHRTRAPASRWARRDLCGRRRRRRGRRRPARLPRVARRRSRSSGRASCGAWRSCCAIMRSELAAIDAANCGNPVREMVSDAMVAAAQIDFFAGLVTEMKGASIPMGPDVVNFSVREPVGVVARIMPFNHPFMFAAGKSAAPLAAGNVVVIKPPDQSPLSALRLAELVDGLLPAGVFNVLPGDRDTGAALASHKDVAMVALIGSVAAGRAVMRAASETVKPVLLELGGKNALIAYADADPDEVAGARGRRDEFHVVRPIVRFDQPRLRARRDPRCRAGASQGTRAQLPAGHRHRSGDDDGRDRQPGAARARAGPHRLRQERRRAPAVRRQPPHRSRARQGLFSSTRPSSPTSRRRCASRARKSSDRCWRS